MSNSVVELNHKLIISLFKSNNKGCATKQERTRVTLLTCSSNPQAIEGELCRLLRLERISTDLKHFRFGWTSKQNDPSTSIHNYNVDGVDFPNIYAFTLFQVSEPVYNNNNNNNNNNKKKSNIRDYDAIQSKMDDADKILRKNIGLSNYVKLKKNMKLYLRIRYNLVKFIYYIYIYLIFFLYLFVYREWEKKRLKM